MNYAVFGKTMKNVKKHRDTKLVTTESRRNNLGIRTTNIFTENLLAIEILKKPPPKTIPALMNKSVYLGLSFSD